MTLIQSVFAENVRKYRKDAHLSQEKLAELAGLHRTYIGGIEQQRVNVSLKNVGKIAFALGVDPALLFLSSELVESDEADGRKRETSRFAGTRNAKEHSDNMPEAASSDYALVSWRSGQIIMRPIDITYEDLTVQILCALALKGYKGSELAKRYSDIHNEIIAFLEEPDSD